MYLKKSFITAIQAGFRFNAIIAGQVWSIDEIIDHQSGRQR
jgi:hypothetical protein